MSLADIRPYFRARLKTVSPGLSEWVDTPDTLSQNIPQSVISQKYHIELGSFGESAHDQDCLTMTGPVTIKLWSQKGREPQKAIDSLIATGESLIKQSLRASNRVTQPGIKNVELTSFSPVAFDVSNDNRIELTVEFNLTIILEIPKGDL